MSPTLRGMIAAIAAVSIFSFSLSLSIPLLAILLEEQGASGLWIGMNSAAAAIAMLIGGPLMPLVLRRASIPIVLTIAASVMAGTLLMFLVVADLWLWLGLRFVLGFCGIAIFFCSEIWVVSSAPPARRGFIIGIYVFVMSIGFFAGPALLSLIGHEGALPFILGALVSAAAIIPVLFAWADAPEMEEQGEQPNALTDVWRFFRSDPAVMGAVALFAWTEFGAMSLFPVWSLKIGMAQEDALTLVALLALGNVVLQLPMGWLSDKFDRRRLLALCAAASLGAAFLFPALSHTEWPLWIATAAWGGVVVGLYTFSLNELGARYSGAEFARANGTFMSAYGLGALIAPPLLGAAMDAWPPNGMFWVLAAVAGGYLALLLLRKRRVA